MMVPQVCVAISTSRDFDFADNCNIRVFIDASTQAHMCIALLRRLDRGLGRGKIHRDVSFPLDNLELDVTTQGGVGKGQATQLLNA